MERAPLLPSSLALSCRRPRRRAGSLLLLLVSFFFCLLVLLDMVDCVLSCGIRSSGHALAPAKLALPYFGCVLAWTGRFLQATLQAATECTAGIAVRPKKSVAAAMQPFFFVCRQSDTL